MAVSPESITTPAGFVLEYDDDKHAYWINGEPVVSVTQALSVLDKSGPLIWWAWKMGLTDAHEWMVDEFGDARRQVPATSVDLEAELKSNGLHPNAKRDKAADRGVGAHHALEQLAATGRLDLSKIEPGDQGYASAVYDWWLEANPTECVTEQMVGSVKHGFAGRYDLDCRIDGARYLVDLKTGAKKGIYESHAFQLAGYEIAAEESGYGRFDKTAILKAMPDGEYQFVETHASADDFLAVKAAYDAMHRVKQSMKKPRKAKAA